MIRLPLLVVDDEPMVRTFMAEALRRQGHDVLEAPDAESAAELASHADGPAIRALVTDVRMPGMTGPQLVHLLRERHPGLPALYVSGDIGGVPLVRGALNEAPVLSKPFRASDLVEAVTRMLAET